LRLSGASGRRTSRIPARHLARVIREMHHAKQRDKSDEHHGLPETPIAIESRIAQPGFVQTIFGVGTARGRPSDTCWYDGRRQQRAFPPHSSPRPRTRATISRVFVPAMSLAASIARANLGAETCAESALGHGRPFIVTVPATLRVVPARFRNCVARVRDRGDISSARRLASSPGGDELRLLLVDHNGLNAMPVLRLMAPIGFGVVTASNLADRCRGSRTTRVRRHPDGSPDAGHGWI
jgi:hypothetical protein